MVLVHGLDAQLAVERGQFGHGLRQRFELWHDGPLQIVFVEAHAVHGDAERDGGPQEQLGVRLVGAEHVGGDHGHLELALGKRVDELRQFVGGLGRFDVAPAADGGLDAVAAHRGDGVGQLVVAHRLHELDEHAEGILLLAGLGGAERQAAGQGCAGGQGAAQKLASLQRVTHAWLAPGPSVAAHSRVRVSITVGGGASCKCFRCERGCGWAGGSWRGGSQVDSSSPRRVNTADDTKGGRRQARTTLWGPLPVDAGPSTGNRWEREFAWFSRPERGGYGFGFRRKNVGS